MVEPEEVFDLLADEYARAILAYAYRSPMSAQELADACDAHHSTIYRRIETLETLGLLADNLRVDPDGHHSTEYRTRLEGISVSIDGDGYDVDLHMREDAADRMVELWRHMRGEEE